MESLAGDLCMVWVIGWLRSTLRIRDIVSLWTHSWVLRVSCDARCYRQQRFKPFGLISMRLVGYTIPQVAEVQTLWLVGWHFLGTRYYRWQRFKPFGLVSVHTEAFFLMHSATGGRGSNPVVCLVRAWGFSFPQAAEVQPFGLSDGVYLVIVSLDWHRFKPCGSTIGLEAWVCGFKSCGLSGHVLKGFCLECKLWVVFTGVFKLLVVTRVCRTRLIEGFVGVLQHVVYCSTPCLEARRHWLPLLLIKVFGLREI